MIHVTLAIRKKGFGLQNARTCAIIDGCKINYQDTHISKLLLAKCITQFHLLLGTIAWTLSQDHEKSFSWKNFRTTFLVIEFQGKTACKKKLQDEASYNLTVACVLTACGSVFAGWIFPKNMLKWGKVIESWSRLINWECAIRSSAGASQSSDALYDVIHI